MFCEEQQTDVKHFYWQYTPPKKTQEFLNKSSRCLDLRSSTSLSVRYGFSNKYTIRTSREKEGEILANLLQKFELAPWTWALIGDGALEVKLHIITFRLQFD